MELSVSILSCKDRLDFVRKLNNTNCDYIHIDTMDGIFVKDKQFPITMVKDISSVSKKLLDIHLMVDDPYAYIKELNNMNIGYITIHIEVNRDINYLVNMIHSMGYKVRLAINPDTSVDKVIPYLNVVEGILIMSVNPGYGGQTFISSVLNKVKTIHSINNKLSISIDGGVNDSNILLIKNSGIDTVVIGSYITLNDDYISRINKIKNI